MMRESLAARFRGAFDGDSTFAVHAPGRVNLIGEHVDYCGLPVFPMAVQRGVTIAARPRRSAVSRFINLTPQFPERRFRVGTDIPTLPPGDWGNYLQAAAQAVARRYGNLEGVDAVVGSDLPIAAGLSSSAALVVAVGMTLLAANEIPYDPLELMEVLAAGEQYVGTAGGGMDQAISLGARAGFAARIEFRPVRLTHVPVPDGWRFLVAWSLKHAEKSGAARQLYNARTRETASAREIIARHLRLGPVDRDLRLFDVDHHLRLAALELDAGLRHLNDHGRLRDVDRDLRLRDAHLDLWRGLLNDDPGRRGLRRRLLALLGRRCRPGLGRLLLQLALKLLEPALCLLQLLLGGPGGAPLLSLPSLGLMLRLRRLLLSSLCLLALLRRWLLPGPRRLLLAAILGCRLLALSLGPIEHRLDLGEHGLAALLPADPLKETGALDELVDVATLLLRELQLGHPIFGPGQELRALLRLAGARRHQRSETRASPKRGRPVMAHRVLPRIRAARVIADQRRLHRAVPVRRAAGTQGASGTL